MHLLKYTLEEKLEKWENWAQYMWKNWVLLRGKPMYTFQRVLLLHRDMNIQQLSEKLLLLIGPSRDLLHFPDSSMKNSLNCLKRINIYWVNHHSLCLTRTAMELGGLLSEVFISPNERFQKGELNLIKFNSHFTQRDESSGLSFVGPATTWSFWSI